MNKRRNVLTPYWFSRLPYQAHKNCTRRSARKQTVDTRLNRDADLSWEIDGTGADKGKNMVWYMNGKSRLGSLVYLPTVGNISWKIVN